MPTGDKVAGSRPHPTVIFKTWEEKRGKLVPQKRSRTTTKQPKPEVKLPGKGLSLAPNVFDPSAMAIVWEILEEDTPADNGQSILEEEEGWYDVDEPAKAPELDPAPVSVVHVFVR